MTLAYVGLGANLGPREITLLRAVDLLAETEGIDVLAVSQLHETEPVGLVEQPLFLNGAVALDTSLSPRELLERLLEIERELGRVRDARWGPRVVDLDLLFDERPGEISMRNFYIEQSQNRYAVNGDVTDWVQVPGNFTVCPAWMSVPRTPSAGGGRLLRVSSYVAGVPGSTEQRRSRMYDVLLPVPHNIRSVPEPLGLTLSTRRAQKASVNG